MSISKTVGWWASSSRGASNAEAAAAAAAAGGILSVWWCGCGRLGERKQRTTDKMERACVFDGGVKCQLYTHTIRIRRRVVCWCVPPPSDRDRGSVPVVAGVSKRPSASARLASRCRPLPARHGRLKQRPTPPDAATATDSSIPPPASAARSIKKKKKKSSRNRSNDEGPPPSDQTKNSPTAAAPRKCVAVLLRTPAAQQRANCHHKESQAHFPSFT